MSKECGNDRVADRVLIINTGTREACVDHQATKAKARESEERESLDFFQESVDGNVDIRPSALPADSLGWCNKI